MRWLIFDLDGTLVDSLPGIVRAVRLALGRLGIPAPADPEIRGAIGDGAPALCRALLEPHEAPTSARVDALVAEFRRAYAAQGLDDVVAFEGIPALLAELRADRLAVVSNKPQALVTTTLARTGLASHFAMVSGFERHAQAKPSPVPLLETLRALGGEPGRAVMIGDGTQDIQAAAGAKIRSIGVTWGVAPAAALMASGADAVVRDVAELRAALAAFRP